MQAQVWNDNIYPHSELYKGETISIPAGGFVTMDYDEAKQFEGQFYPPKKAADGLTQDPSSYKKLRIVTAGPVEPARLSLVCHATGKLAKDEAELKAMNSEHRDMLDEKSRETVEENERLKKELDELRAAYAAREATKKGPGRPKKEE